MKYFISEPWFQLRETLISKKNISSELKAIHKNGFIVVKDFINKEKCDFLIKKFEENLSNKKVWKDDVNSDTRIYGIENIEKEFDTIFHREELNSIFRSFISSSMKSIILCNHIVPRKDNKGSGGGWHRDSIHRRQLKFILYLSDAKVENGCFQYMSGSHKVWKKFTMNKYLNKSYGAYRYSENEIEKLVKNGYSVKNIEGQAGDLIIVDTSGIHRGHPITSGERYAVTKYMWERRIPESIRKILVEK